MLMVGTLRSSKSSTGAGSVSDGSNTSARRRDREPSDSTLSSRAESIADSQISRVSSIVTTGLQTVGLHGKLAATVSRPTGNEDRAPAGMRKKWQQHYNNGKWIQLGKFFCQIAYVVFFVMCVLWSQLLYPLALNSKVLFEAIIDRHDQAASDTTYNKWLKGLFSNEDELMGEYSLHSFYLWHITNPSETLLQGFKPRLDEVGPFGYVKRTTKYDAYFADAGSDTVTYRSWTVFDAVEDNEDCRKMFFRMGNANLRRGIPDCDGDECNCVDDAQNVTVINPPFLKLLNKYEPKGLISTLSREVFADIKDGMTVGFVRATKAYLLPSVLEDVFTFRKAFLTLDGVLRKLFNAISTINGTATAVTTLRGDHDDTPVDCQGFQPTGYSNVCPWGLLSFVESAASLIGITGKFTEAEAEYLLGLRSPTNGSIFDKNGGMLAWIAAGRYSGYIPAPSMPHPSETDLVGEESVKALIRTVCTWEVAAGGALPTSTECQAKVSGILEWLFGVWYTEENELHPMLIDEWRGIYGDGGDFVCDVTGGTCPWGIANATERTELNISAASAVLMIDPSEDDTRNKLSLFTVGGQTLWSQAYTYCVASVTAPIECDKGKRFVQAAEEILPGYFSDADGASRDSTTYQTQVCAVATNVFGSWVGDSVWLNHIVANYLNATIADLTGYTLNGDRVEDIGYVQWTTGAVSDTLLGLKTLSTINQNGIWEFMDESRHMLGPEFWTQVAIAGYPNMGNITVEAGKVLLNLLAEDSDAADKFRRFVLGQSTTYFGGLDDWWEGPSSSTRTFDPGDAIFIEENPYADFSLAAWETASTISSELDGLFSWLDTAFMSSGAQCLLLEGLYEQCLELVADGEPWPSNCVFFQTIISNTVSTLECDETRIYGNAHSYPKKPGNVLASFMYNLAWNEVLKKERLVCSEPDDCDFSTGGFFTTQKARDVLFEGYTDALSIKLMNKELTTRNLTIQCSRRHVIEWNMYCQRTYDGDCTNTGYQVTHDTYGIVLEVDRTGPSQHLWYAAELDLPFGLGSIANPVFAVYPGGNWDNETFQKNADCEKRFLQGDAGLWKSCETTVETGSRDPDNIGSTTLFYGNDSLLAAPNSDSSLKVYGTDATQDTPRKWDGFGEYKLVYLFRKTGREYLGNDTVVILKGDFLLQFHMARDISDAALQYPTRYLAEENVTFDIDINIRVNRYIAQTQNWLDARERVGDNLLADFNGMPYSVPKGMVSTQVLTGYSTFVSDPHFLTNDLLDQQASEQLLFRLERSAFTPDILSSESSFTVCRSPTKDTMTDGAGCFMYVPMIWFDDQRVMDPESAATLVDEFLVCVDGTLDTAWDGLIVSGMFAAVGLILWAVFRYLKVKFERKKWID